MEALGMDADVGAVDEGFLGTAAQALASVRTRAPAVAWGAREPS